MIPSDSAQRPVVTLVPGFQPLGRVIVLLFDMAMVGCVTLFYDGVVCAIAFWVEACQHTKNDSHLFKTVGSVLAIGLLVGGLAMVGLLLSKKYCRALAVLLGLFPLALFMQLVCEVL